jgi:hypothetical protein
MLLLVCRKHQPHEDAERNKRASDGSTTRGLQER